MDQLPTPVGPPAPRAGGRGVRILRPLRRRDFALLFGGTSVSLLGDGIYIVALAWQVYFERVKLSKIEKSFVAGGLDEPPSTEWMLECLSVDTLRDMMAERARETGTERSLPGAAVDCFVAGLREMSARRIRWLAEVPGDEEQRATAFRLWQICLVAAESTNAS